MNKSGLKPLGKAVLIEPYEPEIKKSIIELPQQVQERTRMVETRAIVIEAGPSAWVEEAQPRAKPGDRVLISKFAGVMISPEMTEDGKSYRLVNDMDIFCQIEVGRNGS
jgi:co-chaperonin GroES (HSP10)